RVLRHAPPPSDTLFPYTTLFRSQIAAIADQKRPLDGFREGDLDMPEPLFIEARPRGETFNAPPLALERLALDPDRLCERLDTCRSEEHTSELQSRENLVCRLLLE